MTIPNLQPEHAGIYICETTSTSSFANNLQKLALLRVNQYTPLMQHTWTEATCNHYENITCQSGECLPKGVLCDGKSDCSDFSDEIYCGPQLGINMKISHSQQTVKEGAAVVLSCQDKGFNHLSVKWRRADNRPLPPGSIHVKGQLTIPNIQPEHGGPYICSARGVPPYFTNAESLAFLVVQSSTALHLRHPKPEVKCKSKENIPCNNGLCIPKEFICDGDLDCPDKSDEQNCEKDPCTNIEVHPEMQKIIEGGSVIFQCSVDGCPHAAQKWSRSDGQPLPHNSAYVNGILILVNIQVEDGGAYVCHVNNSSSSKNSTTQKFALLQVIQFLDIKLKAYPKKQTAKLGEKVLFICRDEGKNHLNVEWRRAAKKPLPPGSSDCNGRLLIPKVRSKDRGTYICSITDKPRSSTAEKAVMLTVDSSKSLRKLTRKKYT